jgi:hypothetical protein
LPLESRISLACTFLIRVDMVHSPSKIMIF